MDNKPTTEYERHDPLSLYYPSPRTCFYKPPPPLPSILLIPICFGHSLQHTSLTEPLHLLSASTVVSTLIHLDLEHPGNSKLTFLPLMHVSCLLAGLNTLIPAPL